MDISKTLVKFTGEKIEKYYDQFFNPNICHICKNPNQGNLIPCTSCGIIFYCSEEHKMKHENSHLQFCIRIKHEIESDIERNSRFTNEDWLLLRRSFLYKIISRSKDVLKPYEVEMMLCTKSCFICHQQTNLKTCEECYSVNYCNDHETNFKEEHISSCKSLLVLLNINILTINGVINVTYPNYVMFNQVTSKIDNMFMFLDKYIKEYDQHHELQPYGTKRIWKWQCYIYSDYASAPLTLYHALMKIENSSRPILQDNFTVHILAAISMDIRGLPSWELLMHCFPQIKKLNIVLIIPREHHTKIQSYDLCNICIGKREMVSFGMSHVSYNDYVRKKLYKEANVMITYETKLYIGEDLLKIFILTRDRECPLIFTSRSRSNAEENLHMIQKFLRSKNIDLIENKFQSYRPYRDYTTGEMFYRNVYIAIFRNK